MGYLVGGEQFASKNGVRARIRSVIAGYSIGTSLQGSDYDFVLGLLKCHPRWADKIGGGLAYIHVGPNDFGRRALFLSRMDGAVVDISWVKCVAALVEVAPC